MRCVSQRGVKGWTSWGVFLAPFPASAAPCLPAVDPGPSIQDPQTAPPRLLVMALHFDKDTVVSPGPTASVPCAEAWIWRSHRRR